MASPTFPPHHCARRSAGLPAWILGLVILLPIFGGTAQANLIVNQDPPGSLQNSPSIVRDPASGNLVSAYTQNPFAPLGIGGSYSSGGVGPWTTSNFAPWPAGWFGTQLDASVCADGAGFVYAGLVSYDQLPPNTMRSGIFVHRSQDGGMNFLPPVPVSLQVGAPGSLPFEIKPKVEADDSPPSPFFQNVYCTWERDLTDWTHSDVCFSASPVGGNIWAPPTTVNDRTGLDFVLWPDLAVAPNGDVAVAWLDTPFMAQARGWQGTIRADRSTDGGNTFGVDRTAAILWTVPGTLSDLNGQPTHFATSYPSVEIDPGNANRVCAVYAARPGGGLQWETRLDAGDMPPGSADADVYSAIHGGTRLANAQGWVYDAWSDNRSGTWEIYVDRTPSTPPTWAPPEVRVSNFVGAHPGSTDPTLACDGTNVWVTWAEGPSSSIGKIQLNRSTDSGVTWLTAPVRLDYIPGALAQPVVEPVVSASGSNVYVAWVASITPGAVQDVRINRSSNAGQTWLATEIPLTSGLNAMYHDVACTGNNVYVVWTQFVSATNSCSIWLRQSTNAGQTWLAPRRLDSAPVGATLWGPRVCCSGNNVYVAWHDKRMNPVVDDVWYSCSNDGGVSWAADRSVTGNNPFNNWSFHLTANGPNVYVTYASDRNNVQGFDDVYINCSNSAGAGWNGETRLNSGTPPGQGRACFPRVSTFGLNVYVVWQDGRSGSLASNWDIYGTHSTNGGLSWIPADYKIDVGDPSGATRSEMPEVTSNAVGAFYAWRDTRNGLGDIYANALQFGQDEADVFYIESLDGGVTWTTPLRVNDDVTTNDQSHPWLDLKPNGTVDVVWYDTRNDPNDRLVDVYFAALLSGTTAFQPNVRVTTQSIAPPAGGWLGDYNGIEVSAPIAHLVWTDTRRDPVPCDIYYDQRPNPESPNTGACCLPDGSCIILTPADCLAAAGGFVGIGVPCTPTTCDESAVEPAPAPTEFRLLPPAPSPFSTGTVLRFDQSEARAANLSVFTVDGRLVRRLIDGPTPAGRTEVSWDGRDDGGRRLAAGVYLIRLSVGTERDLRTVVLIP